MLQTSIKMPLFCSKCIMNSALQYFYKSKSVRTESIGMRADSKFLSVSQIIIHSSSTNAGYTQHLLTTPNYIYCTATPSKKFFKIFFSMQLPAKWQRNKVAYFTGKCCWGTHVWATIILLVKKYFTSHSIDVSDKYFLFVTWCWAELSMCLDHSGVSEWLPANIINISQTIEKTVPHLPHLTTLNFIFHESVLIWSGSD